MLRHASLRQASASIAALVVLTLALDQAPRVAAARHLAAARVIGLVRQYTTGPQLGFMSEPVVNVLEINMALDGLR